MTEPSVPDPLRPRSRRRKIQPFAINRQLGVLYTTIEKASFKLIRLLRSAEKISGSRIGPPIGSRPMPQAFGSRQPVLPLTGALQVSVIVSPEIDSFRAFFMAVPRFATSSPLRKMTLLSPSSTLQHPERLHAPGKNVQTDTLHHTSLVAQRWVGAVSQRMTRPFQTTAAQPIAPGAAVGLLVSRVRSGGSPLEIGRPFKESAIQSRRQRVVATAPFAHYRVGDEPGDPFIRSAISRGGTALSPLSSPTFAVSRSKVPPTNPLEKENGINGNSRSLQGELYLDDSMLGRWLTQYLSREVIRPRTGIMAIDPRVTPSWGGPSLGI